MIARARRGAPKSVLMSVAAVIALTACAVFARGRQQQGISQSGEQHDMRRVGHVDLQGRPSYQPNVIAYPDGRTIAFAGTHNGSFANPLNGSVVENDGTMIIDATDPSRPRELFHLPAPAGGQSQMVRLCRGDDLPGGVARHVYLLRNVQGGASSGYEVWDVTNPSSPAPVAALTGIRSTHKDWWECSTGIMFGPGSRDVPAGTGKRWRQAQSMVIYDWSHPPAAGAPGTAIPNYTNAATPYPRYIRTFGLPGGQPDATGPVSTSLHGPISARDHPNAAASLARAATPDDVIGNRIYAAWGVGDDGVIQILDRKKLLPPSLGGTWVGDPDRPTEPDLQAPVAGILYMSPDQGGHTSMPIFGMQPASYGDFTEFKTRDVVIVTSEATANKCQEAPHWAFVMDITVENSRTSPPGTRVEPNGAQGPMILSTMSVDPRSGEKYPRGNYCTRGARFGVHSCEENFRNPYYGRLSFIAWFTGGIRVWDIREPQAPAQVAFYVPEANANTVQPDGYMTNNVEVDNRGFVYAPDRNGSGLDILELTGNAKCIGLGVGCRDHDDDDDD